MLNLFSILVQPPFWNLPAVSLIIILKRFASFPPATPQLHLPTHHHPHFHALLLRQVIPLHFASWESPPKTTMCNPPKCNPPHKLGTLQIRSPNMEWFWNVFCFHWRCLRSLFPMLSLVFVLNEFWCSADVCPPQVFISQLPNICADPTSPHTCIKDGCGTEWGEVRLLLLLLF